MKRNIKFKLSLMLSLFIAILTSCVNEDEHKDAQVHKGEEVAVKLVVSLGSSPQTRATESTEADAVGNEYKIFQEDFQVLLYNADGSYRTKVVITQCKRSAYNQYVLEGKFFTFRDTDKDKLFKMVVIANAEQGSAKIVPRDWQANLSEAHLYKQLKFSYNNGEMFTVDILKDDADNPERIPMWGSKTTPITDGATYHITLIRALAKITVHVAPSIASQSRITNVTMQQSSTSGMLTPKNAANHSESYTINQANGADELNIPSDVAYSPTNQPFASYLKDGKKYFCLYIPEQVAHEANSGQGARMVITIDGENYPVEITHPILRNNWYSYVVQSVTPRHANIEVKYQVAEWEERDPCDIFYN